MGEYRDFPHLNEFYKRRNWLAASADDDELLVRATDWAREALGAQVASVYLFGKDGYLHRRKIRGIDKSGNAFEDEWFPEEKVHPGASFTGRVMMAGDGRYGAPIWTENLGAENLDPDGSREYMAKLGTLRSLIAVPLNGKFRCFGALEVVNAGVMLTSAPDHISEENVYELAVIGASLAMGFTRFRLTDHQTFLQDVSGKLVEAIDGKGDLDAYCKYITDYLVSSKTEYAACILRIGTTLSNLRTVSHSEAQTEASVSWEGFLEAPDHRGGVLEDVYLYKTHVIEPDLDNPKRGFFSQKWIQDNKLKTYAGFPLLMGNSVVGVLSIFVQYHYEFSSDVTLFLKNIASLAASYHDIDRLYEGLLPARQKVEHAWEELVKQEIDSHLHDVSDSLERVRDRLRPLAERLGGNQLQVLTTQVEALDALIAGIDERVTNEKKATGTVQPNAVIAEILRDFRDLTRHMNIKLTSTLSRD